MPFSRGRHKHENALHQLSEAPLLTSTEAASKQEFGFYDSDEDSLSYDADNSESDQNKDAQIDNKSSDDISDFEHVLRRFPTSWPPDRSMNKKEIIALESPMMSYYGSVDSSRSQNQKQMPKHGYTKESLMEDKKSSHRRFHPPHHHKMPTMNELQKSCSSENQIKKNDVQQVKNPKHHPRSASLPSHAIPSFNASFPSPSTSIFDTSTKQTAEPACHCVKSPSLSCIPERHHLKNPESVSSVIQEHHRKDEYPLQPSANYAKKKMVMIHSQSRHRLLPRSLHRSENNFLSSIQDVDQSMKQYVGAEQPRKCRGIAFAIFFLLQAAIVCTIGTVRISEGWRGSTTSLATSGNLWATVVLVVTFFSGNFASAMCGLIIYLMTIVYKRMIQIALITACGLSVLWGVFGVAAIAIPQEPASSGISYVPCTMGFVACMACTGYTVVVWDHIPFASANLHVAMMAIRSASSVIWLMTFIFQMFTLLWSIFWAMAVAGVCENIDAATESMISVLALVFLVFSFFWTFQVIANVVQVAVAKVVVHWWEKNPDDENDTVERNGRFSSLFHIPPVMHESLLNATFYSFGSICMGSLLVAPIQVYRQMAKQCCPTLIFRNSPQPVVTDEDNNEKQKMVCSDATSSRTYDGISSCNPWALVYVSVYGYPFIEAGQKATALLRARGWGTVVSDDYLISNALILTSFVIGGCTCCFGLLVADLLMNSIDSGSPNASANVSNSMTMLTYLIGLVVGFAISFVAMGVVISAVHTTILCYASRPVCFAKAHPELCEELFNGYNNAVQKHHNRHKIRAHREA